jgi:hypothetical protein
MTARNLRNPWPKLECGRPVLYCVIQVNGAKDIPEACTAKGDEGVSDKTGWEGRGHQFADSDWGTRDPCPESCDPSKERTMRWNPSEVYSVGLLGATTEIPAQMKKSLPYVIAVFVLLAWLSHSQYASLSGRNPVPRALGFNLIAIGLPILLLVFNSRWLYRSLREQEITAPYKSTFGSISGSLALCLIPDLFDPSASHRRGAGMCIVLFGIIATILLVLAYKDQRRVKAISMSKGK